ncbi:unnamed protein product [Cylindrotheca closterium]|uniref:Protein ENHANCED DISEASE RESISTANCE 2 C-terminal domain-containing protein n=1 Tax=Cylindrotheca closterium TaxID=2856 RepID=A0AAD2FIF9_9STRA|nr:unnamed protein product [Cylindrotheca closterium]
MDSCFCNTGDLLMGSPFEPYEETAMMEEKHASSFRKPKSQDSVTYVNSSSSSLSTLDQDAITITNSASDASMPKAGRASPKIICQPRKHSTAIAKSVDSKHPFLMGRTAMVLNSEPSKLTVPREWSCTQFRNEPSPLRKDAWSEPKASNFQVRGKNYILDGKKFPSKEAAFQLLAVDMVHSEGTIREGLCGHPNERVQRAIRREKETGVSQLPPFIFAVNLSIPGTQTYHLVSYYAVENMEEIEHQKTPFGRIMNKFIFGDSDEFRNETFKLIPRIIEGNYIVRSAVGSKPSIIGKKIKQYYILGERYMEVVVDISSDSIAQRIVRLALGYSSKLVTDIMYVLEGKDEEELPERIFGGLQLRKIDLGNRDGQRKVQRWKV